jgi:hypothetical protein
VATKDSSWRLRLPSEPLDDEETPARVRQTVDPETLTDEEYAAWLDEYPSRAMAPGYSIVQWRALTPLSRTARQVDGIRPGEEPWSP